MHFIDNEHELFFINTLKEIHKHKRIDAYYVSLVYTLGISEVTREHFNNIFNVKEGEINIDSIEAPWQTDTSAKVTRMVFSLWNRCAYDSIEDWQNNKASSKYNPIEIFSCTYAPYFYGGVKIRYPEYTREAQQAKPTKQIQQVKSINQTQTNSLENEKEK